MAKKSNYRSPLAYFIEFLIIIAGIMVSFLLNEWRENEKVRTQKFHLLEEINKDLRIDSLMLDQAISFYKRVVRSHDSLLDNRNRSFQKDSLDNYLDHFVSYYPFNETATTYQKILNQQDLSFNQEDTLIEYYMALHKQVYPNLHEWLFIEKEFVLKQALPFMDQYAPFIYPAPKGKSFDGNVFYELRKQDHFMNLLKSGRLYKESIITVTSSVFSYVKYIKSGVNKQISALETSTKH